jgi:AraC-like DNA-binding protein
MRVHIRSIAGLFTGWQSAISAVKDWRFIIRQQILRLANRAGRYGEAPPIPPLRPHVQCVWENAISPDHSGPVAVVPDGCVDLLWRDERLTVVGPDMTAAYPDLKPGATVLGIRFKPGAAADWLGLAMSEIAGREIPMTDLWGAKAQNLTGEIGEAPTDHARFQILQRFLAEDVPKIGHPRQDAAIIHAFLKTETETESRKILSLRRQLGVSERTLRRRCDELFGYGPKTLDRILRFQRFQVLAQTAASEGLAILALRAGYADQAHLSREIKSLCGMTAGAFVRQLTC